MIKLWISVCIVIASQTSFPSIAAEAHAAAKAKNTAEDLVADIDEGIKTIDWLLRNPNRRLINGSIEGNLPRFLQYGARADAQAAFDQIKSQAANSLIANSLIQTGTMPKFDAELKRIRSRLYDTRTSAITLYNFEYADLIAGNPSLQLNVPPIADRYISIQDLRKTREPSKASVGWGEAKVVGN